MKGEERRERSIAVKNKTESVVGRSVCVGAEELTTLKDEVRMKSSGERETDNHAGWTGVPQLRSLLGLLGMATGSAAVSKRLMQWGARAWPVQDPYFAGKARLGEWSFRQRGCHK